jgi:hypothetical protein
MPTTVNGSGFDWLMLTLPSGAHDGGIVSSISFVINVAGAP